MPPLMVAWHSVGWFWRLENTSHVFVKHLKYPLNISPNQTTTATSRNFKGLEPHGGGGGRGWFPGPLPPSRTPAWVSLARSRDLPFLAFCSTSHRKKKAKIDPPKSGSTSLPPQRAGTSLRPLSPDPCAASKGKNYVLLKTSSVTGLRVQGWVQVPKRTH